MKRTHATHNVILKRRKIDEEISSKALMDFLMFCIQTGDISMLENQHFQNFLNRAPKKIPSVDSIRKEIVQQADDLKSKLAQEISDFSVTVDYWLSGSGHDFIGTTVHYIKDWKMYHRLIHLRFLDETSADTIRNLTEQLIADLPAVFKKVLPVMFRDCELAERMVAITTDAGIGVESAIRNNGWMDIWVPCVNRVLKCIFDNEQSYECIEQLRSIDNFLRSPEADYLEEYFSQLDLKGFSCIDRSNILEVLDRYLFQKDAIKQALIFARKPELIPNDDVNLSLQEIFKGLHRLYPILKQPRETQPQRAITFPRYWYFYESLKVFIPQAQQQESKKILTSVLQELEKRLKESSYIQWCSVFFHPRSKHLVELHHPNKGKFFQCIAKEIEKQTVTENLDTPPLETKYSLDRIDLDDFPSSLTDEDDEMDEYLKANTINAKDALKFWQEKEVKWPIMTKLALKFLHVQASATTFESIERKWPFETHDVLLQRKAKISDNLKERIILNQNFDLWN